MMGGIVASPTPIVPMSADSTRRMLQPKLLRNKDRLGYVDMGNLVIADGEGPALEGLEHLAESCVRAVLELRPLRHRQRG